MIFKIEVCPSDKTRCYCGCGEKITKGEKRLTANLGSGDFPKHYKIRHFATKNREAIHELEAEIGDWVDEHRHNMEQSEEAQNPFPKCEDCWCQDDTVEETEVIDLGNRVKKYLCNHCIRDYEG